jgi:hypothetical protein
MILRVNYRLLFHLPRLTNLTNMLDLHSIHLLIFGKTEIAKFSWSKSGCEFLCQNAIQILIQVLD